MKVRRSGHDRRHCISHLESRKTQCSHAIDCCGRGGHFEVRRSGHVRRRCTGPSEKGKSALFTCSCLSTSSFDDQGMLVGVSGRCLGNVFFVGGGGGARAGKQTRQNVGTHTRGNRQGKTWELTRRETDMAKRGNSDAGKQTRQNVGTHTRRNRQNVGTDAHLTRGNNQGPCAGLARVSPPLFQWHEFFKWHKRV